jgi:hypothetical protein
MGPGEQWRLLSRMNPSWGETSIRPSSQGLVPLFTDHAILRCPFKRADSQVQFTASHRFAQIKYPISSENQGSGLFRQNGVVHVSIAFHVFGY